MTSICHKIKNYLNRAYPYYYGKWDQLLFILGIVAIFSFSFSYFFEPFEVNRAEHKLDYLWICILHALIPFGIAFVYLMLLNKTQTDERQWTLGKEVLHLSILLLLIGIGSFLVRDVIYENPDNWSQRYFWEEIANTFLIGTLLLAVLLPLNLERLLNKYKIAAGRLNFAKNSPPLDGLSICVETPISSESFALDSSSFLFAKVDGNYTEVYWLVNDVVEKKLIRLSLKDLKKQLSVFPAVFETHRSYLVNIDTIKTVSGNAQGYLISFDGCDFEVPVSRSKISRFNDLFPRSN